MSQDDKDPLPLITRTSRAPARLGIPQSTFFYLARQPGFPKKLRLGPQMTGYLTAELIAWFESKREEA